MQAQFDPTVIGIAVLLWSAAKSIVLLGMTIASVFSRDPARRAAAERIIEWILQRDPNAKDKIEDP